MDSDGKKEARPEAAKPRNARPIPRSLHRDWLECLPGSPSDRDESQFRPGERAPKKKSWDMFDDGHLQLEAVKELNRVDDSYPAPKPDAEPMTFELVIDMKV
jgi:hypothetical protein